jgi:glycosyltransferase involved in cell wall biosynthesis
MSRAKISVIVTAYNAEQYILDALDSVVTQDPAPLETLLIDDGSTDGTVALVEQKLPGVKIISQKHAGVAEARNVGLRHARGDFICLLDADDGWFPGKLAAQLDYLAQHPEVGVVSHAWLDWWPDAEGCYRQLPVWQPPEEPLALDPAQSGWLYCRLLMGCILQTSTLMIRRELVQMTGFFRTDLPLGEDYDYWLRLSRLTKIDMLAGAYSFYRRGQSGSLTSQLRPTDYAYDLARAAVGRWGLSAPDGTTLAKKMFERRLGALAFDFACGHFHKGSARLARQAGWRAFRHDPRRWKALAYVLAALLRQG